MNDPYRLLPEDELRDILTSLRSATERLIALVERGGTIRMPSSLASVKSAAERHKSGSSVNHRDKTEKAREIIEKIRKGGPKHRPKQFDKIGPRISDFVFILADGKFSTTQAAEKISPFVVLSENKREATGQVRSAITRDERFVKTVDGDWMKKTL